MMMDIDTILNRYYNNCTYKYCPDFDYNDDEIQAELLPAGYDDLIVWNIFEARPDYKNILAADGYDVVYHIVDKYDDTKEFIGQVVGDKLYDVTDDIMQLLDEDYAEEAMSFNKDDRLAYGQELYNAYGPDVDTYDLDEYDAECYLAYKRSIGE